MSMPFFDIDKYVTNDSEFKNDVLKYVGFSNHPNKEMIWEYVKVQFDVYEMYSFFDGDRYKCLEWQVDQFEKLAKLFIV